MDVIYLFVELTILTIKFQWANEFDGPRPISFLFSQDEFYEILEDEMNGRSQPIFGSCWWSTTSWWWSDTLRATLTRPWSGSSLRGLESIYHNLCPSILTFILIVSSCCVDLRELCIYLLVWDRASTLTHFLSAIRAGIGTVTGWRDWWEDWRGKSMDDSTCVREELICGRDTCFLERIYWWKVEGWRRDDCFYNLRRWRRRWWDEGRGFR